MEWGSIFGSRRAIELNTLDVCSSWHLWISCKHFKTETDLHIHISHFIFYIDFVYGLFDHSTYDFISWLMFLFMWMLICCGQNQYCACECLWFLFIFYAFISLFFNVTSWFSTCISLLIVYLLVNELSNQKLQKIIPFCFLFWDCASLFLL